MCSVNAAGSRRWWSLPEKGSKTYPSIVAIANHTECFPPFTILCNLTMLLGYFNLETISMLSWFLSCWCLDQKCIPLLISLDDHTHWGCWSPMDWVKVLAPPLNQLCKLGQIIYPLFGSFLFTCKIKKHNGTLCCSECGPRPAAPVLTGVFVGHTESQTYWTSVWILTKFQGYFYVHY